MKNKIKVISTTLLASALMATALVSCGGNTDDIKGPVFYVSPDADAKKADGSRSKPYTFRLACALATPGTTILLKEGTYKDSSRIEIGKDIAEDSETGTGRAGKYITVRPEYDEQRVVFDFSDMPFDSTNRGIQIYSDYWHFYGIEVTGAGDNGMYVAGSHNIIENCQFYNNRDTGLQLGRAYSTDVSIDSWPSYNLIKNCTSFANYDDVTYGENADGYAAKLTVGYGNVFDGCIAFRNSDDGWDLFAKVDSGDIGTVVLYNCVSFENGFLPYKNDNEEDTKKGTYDTLNGDGIGFKLGGSVMKGNVIVNNCLAFNNKLHGVGDNSNPGVISVHNFTAFNNCAGVDGDGKIRDFRGLDNIANKSNNIDLARSTSSYNNYYGVVSYVNNQAKFVAEGDSEYNQDAFRGSTAYSVFNTGYDKGEKYVSFTGYEDASSWATATVDTAYNEGKAYEGMSDDVFADLTAINATCDGREGLKNLLDIHTRFRNADGSVNMGDKIRIKDDKLFKDAAGRTIGAQLNKEKDSDYDHFGMYSFMEEKYNEMSNDEIVVLSAYSILQIIANTDAVYQDFLLPKSIAYADITYKSDNVDVIEIGTNEERSKSDSVFSVAKVHVPDKDTKVKITATLASGDYKIDKTFELTVKSRNQKLGELVSTGPSAIRVNLYSTYNAPRVYALDDSSVTTSEFPSSLYDITESIRYAVSRKSNFYAVDEISTSVAGVYEVTATATLKSDESVKSYLVYRVYVVDPDAPIDFVDEASVTLSSTGFDVTGELSNIEGSVVAVASKTQKTFANAQALLADETVQHVKIETDSITASFVADNSSDNGAVQYYIYYAVVNTNESAATANNSVYTATVKVNEITTTDQFYSLARVGKVKGMDATSTTIYSLKNDLDFTDYKWSTAAKITFDSKETALNGFSGLLRGNGKTIKNITVGDESGANSKSINVIYKISNGTLMDINFDNIKITGTKETKQHGIVGELCGGYVHNVRATNVAAYGKESVGGIIGQVTGGNNYVTNCSLINPVSTKTTLEEINAENNYKITATNKYAGGIIGNVQKNTESEYVHIKVSDCYANAIIGDGSDKAGNMGLIVGRVKNEFSSYETEITRCVAYGLIISYGQYTSGIVGDFDNGAGSVTITSCLSDVSFMYQGLYLNAQQALKENSECQQYAHKNSNPIVGRAVATSGDGIYVTKGNIGSWTEYYSTDIKSASIVFNLTSLEQFEEDGNFYQITKEYLESTLGLDFETVWKFENGVASLR